MKHYDKIRRIGHPSTDGLFDTNGKLVIQEKMDGANFRFHIDADGDFTFGSRNVSYENVPDEDIPNDFRPTIEYVVDTINDSQLETSVEQFGPLTIFGESMHSHTLEYEWDSVPRFLGFDVYKHDSDAWMKPETARDVIKLCGLEACPQIAVVHDVAECDVDEYCPPQSAYRDGNAEGIVVRNTHTNVRAKYVTEQFAEKHGEANSGEYDKTTTSDAERMANRYTGDNNQRIRKTVHKLVDEGYTMEMPLMEQLGPRVIEDIAIEEADEFICENWTVDFHEFRKHINKACVATLKAMLNERARE